MRSDPSVVADPARGIAVVAGRAVAMAPAGEGGRLRFGGTAGTTLRPLTFMERTEVVTAAAALAVPRDAVAAATLARATAGSGDGDAVTLEVLAMWLAGAAWEAPSFAETTLLVARGAGWNPAELLAAPATEIDRLAVYLDEQQHGSEWKSLVFAEPPAEDLAAARARFADRLLRRSTAPNASAAERAPEDRQSCLSGQAGLPALHSAFGRSAAAFDGETALGGRAMAPGESAMTGDRAATLGEGRSSFGKGAASPDQVGVRPLYAGWRGLTPTTSAASGGSGGAVVPPRSKERAGEAADGAGGSGGAVARLEAPLYEQWKGLTPAAEPAATAAVTVTPRSKERAGEAADGVGGSGGAVARLEAPLYERWKGLTPAAEAKPPSRPETGLRIVRSELTAAPVATVAGGTFAAATEPFAIPSIFAMAAAVPELDTAIQATEREPFDLARALAGMLDDEADLRGVER